MFLADYADDLSEALQLASNVCDWHPEDAVFIVNPIGDVIV